MLRRTRLRLVRRQRRLTRTISLLIRLAIVIRQLMNQIPNASILHFYLLNLLILIIITTSLSTIGLI